MYRIKVASVQLCLPQTMADSEIAFEDGEAKGESDQRKTKAAPNRKKFDEDLQNILSDIKMREKEVKDNQSSYETLLSDLRGIRPEKEANIEKRKSIDFSLRNLNQEITKKMDVLTKVQATLHYKNEEKINDAIRRLEHQLKMNNFRLSEEKKIVAEVDSLRRSKKVLSQYLSHKAEIDEMRNRQRRMREERDHYSRKITQIKVREDEVRRKIGANRLRTDELKKEIDSLYEQKRTLVSEFKAQEKVYNSERKELMRKQRVESFKRREEERQAYIQAKKKELEEIEASREPYEEEKHLCTTLMTYLQRYLDEKEGHGKSSEGAAPLSPKSLKQEGMYVLQRKSEEEDMLAMGWRVKPSKRSKKKKAPHHKSLTHTPQTLAQFATLNLTAPSTLAEVKTAVEQLVEKKAHYDSLPAPMGADGRSPPDITVQDCGENSSSVSESDSNVFSLPDSFARSISITESEGSYELPYNVTDQEDEGDFGKVPVIKGLAEEHGTVTVDKLLPDQDDTLTDSTYSPSESSNASDKTEHLENTKFNFNVSNESKSQSTDFLEGKVSEIELEGDCISEASELNDVCDESKLENSVTDYEEVNDTIQKEVQNIHSKNFNPDSTGFVENHKQQESMQHLLQNFQENEALKNESELMEANV